MDDPELPRKREDDEQLPAWPEVLKHLMNDPKFLPFAERVIDVVDRRWGERNANDREKIRKHDTTWRIHTAVWTLLAILTVVALAVGTWYDKLPAALVGSLAAQVIAYLFFIPRQQ